MRSKRPELLLQSIPCKNLLKESLFRRKRRRRIVLTKRNSSIWPYPRKFRSKKLPLSMEMPTQSQKECFPLKEISTLPSGQADKAMSGTPQIPIN